MRIVVGSLNPVKIDAAREVLLQFYPDAEVSGIEGEPGVSNQPFGLEESVTGAVKRAKQALLHGDIGVGLEAGLIPVPYSASGYLDIHFSAISDGVLTTIGSSSGFEYTAQIIEEIKKSRTVGDVMGAISGIRDIGQKQGAVGFLSNGMLTRFELSKQAVLAAMIPRRWSADEKGEKTLHEKAFTR